MIYLGIFIYTWIIGLILIINYNWVRIISFFYLVSFFLILGYIILILNKSIWWYQFIYKFFTIEFYYISYIIGLDGISISFIILCSFIIIFVYLIYWYLNYQQYLYSIILFISLWILTNIFALIDLFFFYIFFEGIVIPMFMLIGIWGSRKRKIYASYLFFIYTLIGSIFVLFVILSVYINKGSASFDFILNSYFLSNRQLILIIFLFIGFGVKIPIMPVHIWITRSSCWSSNTWISYFSKYIT